MERRVICYIQAFDCEHTIGAAMQSVLNQTYNNWRCFVLSNGNGGNGTLDAIKNFAMRDNRFVVMNKRNNDLGRYFPMLYHLAKHFPDAYICTLDGDDVYQNDFFERAVTLAEGHELDIVACGTEITFKKNATVSEEALVARRASEENIIVNRKDFTQQFLIYKPFFNEVWGKLYRASLFDKKHDEKYARTKFRGRFLPDTLFTVDNLSRSRAIGILSGTSHKFYQYEQRSVHNGTAAVNVDEANRRRINFLKPKFTIYTTYAAIMSFLRSCGEVTDELYEYMQAVLFGWFGDFYARTLLPTTDEEKFVNHVYHLVFNRKFDEIMSYQDTGKYENLRGFTKRKEFCEQLINQLIGQLAIKNRTSFCGRSVYCDAGTRCKIEKIIKNLNDTVANISKYEVR